MYFFSTKIHEIHKYTMLIMSLANREDGPKHAFAAECPAFATSDVLQD